MAHIRTKMLDFIEETMLPVVHVYNFFPILWIIPNLFYGNSGAIFKNP
jgi:hypothetical protein